jgi:hypothetical protein
LHSATDEIATFVEANYRDEHEHQQQQQQQATGMGTADCTNGSAAVATDTDAETRGARAMEFPELFAAAWTAIMEIEN